jgi:predicted ATP-grasp superfamily ATP-dependent carboligase
MNHARRLFKYQDAFADVPTGLHLLAGLTGFTDAGATLNQLADHVFANLEHELVVQFENDELLDYRSRRPIMFFERDHIEHYEPATLGLYLAYDEANQPFLYLHGYEPDFKWEAFSDAVMELVEELEVEDFTWVHSIPFPIPHTRAVGVTVSGNRLDIIDSVSEWKPQTQVPGNVLHLLEYRLGQVGLPTVGYVFLVPHYLSESEYPQAAVAAFEQISASTGLVFPTDALREEGTEFLKKLTEQIEKNEELAKMVANLEKGYANEKTGPIRAPISKPVTKMPTAEEIAAELEGYLATRRRNSAED